MAITSTNRPEKLFPVRSARTSGKTNGRNQQRRKIGPRSPQPMGKAAQLRVPLFRGHSQVPAKSTIRQTVASRSQERFGPTLPAGSDRNALVEKRGLVLRTIGMDHQKPRPGVRKECSAQCGRHSKGLAPENSGAICTKEENARMQCNGPCIDWPGGQPTGRPHSLR